MRWVMLLSIKPNQRNDIWSETIMTTGINHWLAMEQPELTVDDVDFGDNGGDDDMRPRKSGPYAVTVSGDDDQVLYFRTPRAATVFVSHSDAPAAVEFVGDAGTIDNPASIDMWADDWADDHGLIAV